jgi:Mg/Co/Ni transporter MgtE
MPMAKTPTVRDYMKKASKTFHQDDRMATCMSVLARSSFAAIPVVDDDGRVIGLLSEKDALRTIISWAYEQRAGGNVRNYVSPLKVLVTPDMDLLTAARAFLECNFMCLPVLDGDMLVGRIIRHDVLKGLDKWAAAIHKERADRLTKTPECECPTAVGDIQKAASTHTREQLTQLFRKN